MYNDNRDIPVNVKSRPLVNKRVAKMAKIMAKRFPPDKHKRVVDIGTRCGYGVQILEELGYHAIGTELIDVWIKEAQKKNRYVIFDDFMKTKLPRKYFDLVFSRHCLEHCRDTLQFFDSCAKILKPGGHVFITFPLEKHTVFEKKRLEKITYHMVCYETLEEFREVSKKTRFEELYFGLSKMKGLKPSKKEVLFIGRLKNEE